MKRIDKARRKLVKLSFFLPFSLSVGNRRTHAKKALSSHFPVSFASFVIGKKLSWLEVKSIKSVIGRVRRHFTSARVENLLWVFSLIPKSFFEKAKNMRKDLLFRLRKSFFISSKFLFHFTFYSSESSWREIGYSGPFVGRVKLPRYSDPEIKISKPPEKDTLYFDVCVVGSGAGGSIVALELSKQGFSVALFEKGEFIPPRNFNEREDHMIPKLYDIHFSDDFSVVAMSGKNLGGSTLHNTALFVKLPDKVFDFWRELGFPINRDTFYSLSDDVFRICDAKKMTEGDLNANSLVFLRGLQKLGFSFYLPHHSRRDCLKVGFCELGCHWNRKFSTTLFVLPKAQKEYGLKIFTGMKATHFKFSESISSMSQGNFRRKTVREMIFDFFGGRRKIRVKAEHFVLSAGALQTPKIIRASCEVRPQGLSLHPSTYVMGEFNEDISGWLGIPISVISEFLEPHRGFILMPYFAHPGAFSVALGGVGKHHRSAMLKYKNIAMVSVLPHDPPSGYVGEGPFFSYKMSKSTVEDIKKGVETAAHILFEAGAKTVILPDIFSTLRCRSMSEVKTKLERLDPYRLPLLSVHPQASLPWGKFLDDTGRLTGFRNLWVADSSVFPSSSGVPPQVSVMTSALFISQMISQELRKEKFA